MSKFSEQVHISISSFEKNVIYYDLQVSQKMADHHYFSFIWQYTGKPVIEPEDQAKAISKFTGSQVIFTFRVNEIRLMSKGIITGLKSIDKDGSPAGLHVFGTSHTIVIDDMPKSRIFLNKNLQQIALDVFDEENSGEFYQREAIVPTYTKEFQYKPQYNETNFDFMKRLSKRYGQWFYFDGMRMQFGQTKASKVKLINGSSLHKFTIEANLISQKTSFSGYDYNAAATIRDAAERTTTGSKDRFAVSMGWNQGSVVRKDLNIGAYTHNAQNKENLEEMVKLQTAGHDANSVFYSGISYLPIGLGQVFTVQNKTVEHQLIAIEIIHCSEVHGNYSCEFRAIPADVEAPHYTDATAFAPAESQSAKIIDNNDPEGLGRVRVKFYWTNYRCDSDWMRVVQSYAGSGKGNYFRPEIGEEVRIGFEGNNAECPYVSGTYYNGQEKPEFFDPQNSIKGWKLRFGMLFKFIEKVGIWLSDPSGNEVHLDEQNKNITITTPGTLTLNCANLILNVDQNMATNVTLNKTDIIGVNHCESIGGSKELGVGSDFNTVIDGKYLEHIKGDYKSTTEKDRHDNSKEGLHHYTEGDLSKNAKKEIQNNSGEQTRQN
ncbi:type VI secretion system Vgr family protein [Flavobacterium sp. HTF]|uniref:type VI secretion system Vgr family protein n=1 Tax=Flavobacterium sp. HTF TaxID=2170732 RepID=UPI000D5CA37B|nr:phage baseplate assembly protein V [Flavobacterium sp. HTF]PWB22521.1 type IV secretion protein Rhs [Flavobacterium sp. HTF]